MNNQIHPKETARNQHLIFNVVVFPQSFAMRKLHEAEALIIHRKGGKGYG